MIPAALDHLALATPDLDATAAWVHEQLGVRPGAGGSHTGLGTRNALASLGPTSYLEVIAPDPAQPEPARPRPFGIDGIEEPRLTAWAVRTDDIDAAVRAAHAAGHDPGEIVAMTRDRPDGVRLAWRLTFPPADGGGVVPFLIDWGGSPHPAAASPAGLELVALRAEHPDPVAVRRRLAALGASVDVDEGPRPRLVAAIRGPRGTVVL